MNRTLRRAGAILWLLAPLLLWLSLHRPFTVSTGRAARVPDRIGEFVLHAETPLTAREHELLGTDDAVWRTYRDAAGGEVFVVAVFHQHNWKSVHPPHLCLRGSDMTIDADGLAEPIALADGGEIVAGRLRTTNRADHRPYLSLFAYGADGLRTGSYSRFVWYHLPRAVLRQSAPGYLLRVDTWLTDQDAEARCRRFLQHAIPVLEGLLQ